MNGWRWRFGGRGASVGLGLLISLGRAAGMFIEPEVEQVPTQRLIANLEQRIEAKGVNLECRYALARVHAIAYAQGVAAFPVLKTNGLPYFGPEPNGPGMPPRQVTASAASDRGKAAAAHLQDALHFYQQALRINAEHLPSQLGLAWCLDQAGNKNAARTAYRKALSLAWVRDEKRDIVFEGPSMTEEIAHALVPLLDPKEDREELAKLESYVQTMGRKGRAVTPIIIPLEDGVPLSALIDRESSVEFDLDGSGQRRAWQWLKPGAGWLVYDPQGSGRITSGLQLFGSVTFWVFWGNGYHALAALDDDGDGLVRGPELEGLAVWCDADADGQSDVGEVKPLHAHGIVALESRYEKHSDNLPYSPKGVRLSDGRHRPSYDWICRSVSDRP